MVKDLGKITPDDLAVIGKTKRNIITTNEQRTTDTPQCDCIDLNQIDYQQAWKLQSDLVAARKDGIIDTDVVLFLEHPAVFTLGRRGGLENLIVSRSFLEKSGIPVVHVERGGNITYHGPGQLVVYPIIDLAALKLKVVDYVTALEEVMIRTAKTWGIPATRNPVNRGIWVVDKKMGSIGIAVRKGISFHGLALNVNLDLTPFCWIQPCGLHGVAMTSIRQEIDRDIPMTQVREVVKQHFQTVFGVKFSTKNFSELLQRLKP